MQTICLGIFLAAVLTILMELPIFILFGYRKKVFFQLFVCVNVATNVSINLINYLFLYFLGSDFQIEIGSLILHDYDFLMFFLELVVIAVEYGAFKALLGPSKKLFWGVVLANAFSGIVGSLLLSWILMQ
jgi:hypothetical protein